MAKDKKRVGNRNPKPIKPIDYKQVNEERQLITEAARKLAEECRKSSPYAVEKQDEFLSKIEAYIEGQEETGRPLTISGFMLAAGIPKKTWYNMAKGEYDTMIFEYKMFHDIPVESDTYTNEDGEVKPILLWSDIVERCSLLTQQQREEACVAGKAGNVIGNIFLLKAQHGLSDMPDMVGHQTNVQIVADAETAIKALEMLK